MKMPKLMLLGAGELGKEVAISAKRQGCRVIAVDSYLGAPAMQVSDFSEVINMLDGEALEAVIRKHMPDHVVPEVEAIRTERLLDLERAGFDIIPSARAANLTMNRDAIRDLAALQLRLPTARFAYAESAAELERVILGNTDLKDSGTGLPCVIKPVMSSSGKGQSVARTRADIRRSWDYAVANMRGDRPRVIAEEFIDFDYEITLLTVRQRPIVAGRKLSEKARTLFVRPIGHRQERGDYQESWMPCRMSAAALAKAQKMAAAVVREIAGPRGAGIFGVEFFVAGSRVIFSELSPRPHDTGMVTLISQDLSEFDLHVRAILGLPIPTIRYERGGAASAVILAGEASPHEPEYQGLDRALGHKGVQVRIFGKPSTRKFRRMGVALAVGPTANAARRTAKAAAKSVRVISRP
ncbi:MAG: formate-dependent phosphoribosylglycinamide formyltransferase [Phycisphaeraceae bacterium]|nr:formate-dependent phosphoribosylglycinamide formyltransferase [Phycisphaeraceae bacterium]